MVEQEFVELLVVGSIPTLGTTLQDNIFMNLNTSKINNKPILTFVYERVKKARDQGATPDHRLLDSAGGHSRRLIN